MFRLVRQVAATGNEVCHLWLHLVMISLACLNIYYSLLSPYVTLHLHSFDKNWHKFCCIKFHTLFCWSKEQLLESLKIAIMQKFISSSSSSPSTSFICLKEQKNSKQAWALTANFDKLLWLIVLSICWCFRGYCEKSGSNERLDW